MANHYTPATEAAEAARREAAEAARREAAEAARRVREVHRLVHDEACAQATA